MLPQFLLVYKDHMVYIGIGIGISQIDGTQNPVSDLDYWNYEGNMEGGLNVLSNKATESQNH